MYFLYMFSSGTFHRHIAKSCFDWRSSAGLEFSSDPNEIDVAVSKSVSMSMSKGICG